MSSSVLEYIIKQKNEGKTLFKKIALLFAYFFLFVILAVLIIALSAPLLQIPFLLVDLAFCSMVAFASWRFFSIEYELIFGGGELVATIIYGKSIRKRKLTVALNALSEIGIYDDEAYTRLCGMSLSQNYLFISSLSAPVIYYAVFDEGKSRCVLYFEADERAISMVKQANPSAIRQGNIKI